MRAATVILVVLGLAGCGGGATAGDVADAIAARGFDPDATAVDCNEAGTPRGLPGFTMWRCDLALEGDGEALCTALSREDDINLVQCAGVRVDPPSTQQVEKEMLLGSDAAGVDCEPTGPSRWRCVFRSPEEGTIERGTYRAFADGTSEIAGSASSSSGP